MDPTTSSHRPWIVAVILLNLVDAISTVVGVQIGALHEANPFMGALLSVSPALFLAVKLGFCVPLLWGWTEDLSRGLQLALQSLTVVYGALAAWHLLNWLRLM